jgi:extracellular factor (EF) 3-hydroxypalmitic acid methyl ester biosynthesis protein
LLKGEWRGGGLIEIYEFALPLLRCGHAERGRTKAAAFAECKASRKGGLMSVQERRKKPRESDGLSGSSFIEIRHTFGPVRKSVYKVLEFNEHGTSFLMPASDGFFRSGHPLEYSLITPDLAKVEGFGVVRYYHPFNDHSGNSYFKVGLEAGRSGGERKPESLRIRPPRLHLSQLKNEHAIFFFAGDKEYDLSLVDISRYSAAFLCDEEEAFNLGISNVLTSVEITFGPKTIFEGTVVVTKRTPYNDKYRIVVEPRSAVFNIDAIEEQERLTSVAGAVHSLLNSSQKFRDIHPEFKAVTADMRAYLEGLQEILNMPLAARPTADSQRNVFLDELLGMFSSRFDEYWSALDHLIESLDLDDTGHSLYRSYLQSHIHSLILSAPICHRIFYKPLGYPGDFEMMRMIRDNHFIGGSHFSKLIHAYALKTPMAIANRNRIHYLSEKIASFVEGCDAAEVRILSIASGPALEIQHLIETKPHLADRIHITLLDQEVEALRYSQDSIYMKRIINTCGIQVDLIHQSVGSFLKQIARGKGNFPTFDMIYIFGLFDYFDDRMCSFCMNKSAALLNNNGKMIVSNYSLDGHRHRTFLEYAFEWFMIYRNRERMEYLAKTIQRPCTYSIDQEELGVIKFLELNFGAAP